MRAMLHSREDVFPVSLFNRLMKNGCPVCIVYLASAASFLLKPKKIHKKSETRMDLGTTVKSRSFLSLLYSPDLDLRRRRNILNRFFRTLSDQVGKDTVVLFLIDGSFVFVWCFRYCFTDD